MAKRRQRPASNPLLKDQVAAITAPAPEPAKNMIVEPTETPGTHTRSPMSTPRRSLDRGKAVVQIKARFSQAEAEQVERFARTISSYLRSTVKGSEVTRALWTLAIRAEDELAEIASKAPKMDRPSYGDRLGMAEYEDAIADFLLLALKETRRQ